MSLCICSLPSTNSFYFSLPLILPSHCPSFVLMSHYYCYYFYHHYYYVRSIFLILEKNVISDFLSFTYLTKQMISTSIHFRFILFFQQNSLFIFLKIILVLLLCWGYIVTFIKVLTIDLSYVHFLYYSP
jgi:hypothetical protein